MIITKEPFPHFSDPGSGRGLRNPSLVLSGVEFLRIICIRYCGIRDRLCGLLLTKKCETDLGPPMHRHMGPIVYLSEFGIICNCNRYKGKVISSVWISVKVELPLS